MNSIARSSVSSAQTEQSQSRLQTVLSMPLQWWAGIVALAGVVVYALSRVL